MFFAFGVIILKQTRTTWLYVLVRVYPVSQLYCGCSLLQTNESRQIYHLQFTSWPDYGTPSSAAAFLEFLFKVRACQEEAVSSLGSEWQGHPLGPPVLVHCSAGIGRTGQFYPQIAA